MVNGYHLDKHPKANVANEHYAVVSIPRLKRDRVPESSVRIVADKHTAIAESNKDNHQYAAKVMGPARSSEGFNLFYIISLY